MSEGRDAGLVGRITAAAGPDLLDVHTDPFHNRSVLTLWGTRAARAVARAAVNLLDLRDHVGVHPRFGVIDVVPFVALGEEQAALARAARDEFAGWAGSELGVPSFLYGHLDDGSERTLPDLRRLAFAGLEPDFGPGRPHPTAGAMAVGARPVLVAYNLWLAPGASIEEARGIARRIRSPEVRALGFEVGAEVQVSMNLLAPQSSGPDRVYDAVAAESAIARAELVGLIPEEVLTRVPPARWAQLDLDPAKTIEARLRRRRA